MDDKDEEEVFASKRVYDNNLKEADFRKRKVTDTGLNKRIKVPDPACTSKEVKIQGLVDALEEVAVKAGMDEVSCLRAGKPAVSTLSESAKKGRDSLKAREKAGELVILSTDKSGKRAVMSREKYIETMQPHIDGDSSHTREEVDLIEKHFNGAAAQILKAFRVGEDWHQEERLKSAYSASHNQVPSLNQTVKDHKKELKTRALCHAQAGQSPNGPLAALVGELLDPFLREIDQDDRTEVKSTEELCHEVGKVNKRVAVDGPRRGPFQVDGRLIVGGKDAEAFYPNIDIETAAEEAKLEIIESDVEVKGLATENVALFLACSMTQEQIDAEGLTNVVHTRKNRKGAKPGLTCKAITGGPKTRDSDKIR